jgi:hypothetical protein
MIKRYTPDANPTYNCEDEWVAEMVESPDGQYVAYADAHNLAMLLTQVAESLADFGDLSEEECYLLDRVASAFGYKDYEEMIKAKYKE